MIRPDTITLALVQEHDDLARRAWLKSHRLETTCLLWQALNLAGLPVWFVGNDYATFLNGTCYDLDPDAVKAVAEWTTAVNTGTSMSLPRLVTLRRKTQQ